MFAGILLGLYWLLLIRPLEVAEIGNVGEFVFGRDLRYLLFGAALVLIFAVVRLNDAVLFGFILSRKRDVVVPLLLREIVSVVLYILLLAAVTSRIFHSNITAFLATGTILAAVIGLALQDTLGNLFSGISLHMERTFEVGDVIRSGEYMGVVERSSWRATRIRTFNNNVVLLPNSLISKERLEIFPRANLNARIVTVGAPYEIPPARVISVLVKAAENVDGVAQDAPCIARVGGFAESSVTYEIKYFTRDYARRDIIDADIRRAVWYAFNRNGISIPFPIRSLQRYAPSQEKEVVGPDEVLSRILSVDILAPLSAEEHAMIAAGTTIHTWGRGETILRFGDAGDSMFVVHAGSVAIRIPGEAGETEVAQLGPGGIFGEMALLTGEARTADVVGLTEVVALKVGKGALHPVLSGNPGLAAALSAKVVERRRAAAAVDQRDEDEETSVLDRISSWFGI